jgi:hypothetical protein
MPITLFSSSVTGASLLVYQLFLYPRINKILGPINPSRIAAVSKSLWCYLVDPVTFFFLLLIRTILLHLADPVHPYPFCLPLHDIPVRTWIINRSQYCISDKK